MVSLTIFKSNNFMRALYWFHFLFVEIGNKMLKITLPSFSDQKPANHIQICKKNHYEEALLQMLRNDF